MSTTDYDRWFRRLKDRAARARILAKIRAWQEHGRVFGDIKPVGSGVIELRVHSGPGYRIYFAQQGDVLVILLAGGDKSTQDRDIKRAQEMLRQLEGEGTWLI